MSSQYDQGFVMLLISVSYLICIFQKDLTSLWKNDQLSEEKKNKKTDKFFISKNPSSRNLNESERSMLMAEVNKNED